MTIPTQPARWRDFAHTASVKLASALADSEARAQATTRAATRVVRHSFSFALLAAATSEAPTLPTGGFEAAEGGLSMTTAVDNGRIRVGLQLEGIEALESGADCDARMVSDNGTLDVSLHFDEAGRAALSVADTAAFRVALTKVRVDVLAEPDVSDSGG